MNHSSVPGSAWDRTDARLCLKPGGAWRAGRSQAEPGNERKLAGVTRARVWAEDNLSHFSPFSGFARMQGFAVREHPVHPDIRLVDGAFYAADPHRSFQWMREHAPVYW